MRIVSASIENFKRVVVARIDPPRDVVEINGKNGQGKSSILDAIESALSGRRSHPKAPIRKGADSARVVLELDELKVERVWSRNSDRLVVTNADGSQFSAAQAKLDELIEGLAFDPLGFLSMNDKSQRDTLLKVIGVDLDGIEERREEAFRARRAANRAVKEAEARLSGAEKPPADAPENEVDLRDLTDELSNAMATRDKNEELRRAAGQKRALATQAADEHADQLERIETLEKDLQGARDFLAKLEKAKRLTAQAASRAQKKADDAVDPDLEEIQQRIAGADSRNRAYRTRVTHDDLRFEVERLRLEAATFQEALDGIDEEKRTALADAEMPVEGLEITDAGVEFDGIPLAQASMSMRIRICVAIGAALNPQLRIALVRAGNDLDDESLKAFYESCRDSDLQAWVERIAGIEANSIVIEEGEVS